MAAITVNGGHELGRSLVQHISGGKKLWFLLTSDGRVLVKPEHGGGWILMRRVSGSRALAENWIGIMEHVAQMRGMKILRSIPNRRAQR